MADKVTYYATGHRKNATARVWLSPGTGEITINRRQAGDYLGRKTLEMIIQEPFEVTETVGKFDVMAIVMGGGVSGQLDAV
ncbi:MAG: 30S ribosomal protein S9, partial [Armatimonadota bacterium]